MCHFVLPGKNAVLQPPLENQGDWERVVMKKQRGVQDQKDTCIASKKLISSWVTILRTLQMSVRTGHGIKYWYKDFSWLLKHLNILIKIIGMSIRSIIELHSNPDFLVDTSIILCHQKFSWFQTKDTKFHAIIPTFKIQ